MSSYDLSARHARADNKVVKEVVMIRAARVDHCLYCIINGNLLNGKPGLYNLH